MVSIGKHRLTAVLGIISVLVIASVVVISKRDEDQKRPGIAYDDTRRTKNIASELEGAVAVDSSSGVSVGASRPTKVNETLSTNVGVTLAVVADVNRQVASVAEARKRGKEFERLWPLMQPKPFDRKAFDRDPQAYLTIVEPEQVFEISQPGRECRSPRPKFPYVRTLRPSTSLRLYVVLTFVLRGNIWLAVTGESRLAFIEMHT